MECIVQTFLPYPDFAKSAKCLDMRRLGKQRVEALQIYNALSGTSRGWRNHPATLMWAGCRSALAMYHNECITEWVRRGYKNTMPLIDVGARITLPSWLGDDAFHAAHRSNLLRKDPLYYGQFKWREPLTLPYIWPQNTNGSTVEAAE